MYNIWLQFSSYSTSRVHVWSKTYGKSVTTKDVVVKVSAPQSTRDDRQTQEGGGEERGTK
jgi:hypothetical protein